MDDWFNLTATFKPTSNVVMNYHDFKDLTELHRYRAYFNTFSEKYKRDKYFFENQLSIPKKSLVLWFVSHCSTASKREKYIQEMQKYIDIDIYGSCNFKNSKPDPCRYENDAQRKNECLNNLYNSYKFYLAFENCNCDYYITEKYWKLYYVDAFFNINIIPVVQGPKHEHYGGTTFGFETYIHTDQFKSPQSLSNYLLYLNQNQTAYLEYFKWKRKSLKNFEEIFADFKMNKSLNFLDRPYADELSPFCEICSKLHDTTYLNSHDNKIIKITDFFNPDKDCSDKGDSNYLKTFLKNIIGKCL